jgi:hypothetical protein
MRPEGTFFQPRKRLLTIAGIWAQRCCYPSSARCYACARAFGNKARRGRTVPCRSNGREGLSLDHPKAGSLPPAPLFGPSDTFKNPMVGETSSQLTTNQSRFSLLRARHRLSSAFAFYDNSIITLLRLSIQTMALVAGPDQLLLHWTTAQGDL